MLTDPNQSEIVRHNDGENTSHVAVQTSVFSRKNARDIFCLFLLQTAGIAESYCRESRIILTYLKEAAAGGCKPVEPTPHAPWAGARASVLRETDMVISARHTWMNQATGQAFVAIAIAAVIGATVLSYLGFK